MTRRRLCFLLLVPLVLGGCHSWRIADPGALFQETSARAMRATLADGSILDLDNSFVRNDSLYGQGERSAVRMPLSDVQSIQILRFSATRTTALVVAHAATVIGFIAFVIHIQPHYQGF